MFKSVKGKKMQWKFKRCSWQTEWEIIFSNITLNCDEYFKLYLAYAKELKLLWVVNFKYWLSKTDVNSTVEYT